MRQLILCIVFTLAASSALACMNDSACAADQICQCPSSSPTGNCDTAGQCIPRGSENEERASLPFSVPEQEVIAPYLAEGDDVLQNPLSFVRLISQGACGPRGFGGQFLAIENTHPAKPIWVTYMVSFYYQSQPRTQTKTGKWSAGRTNPVGCTVPGPTGQRFTYRILSARF